MKRSSTPIPELPTPPRRKRSLSEEERALWESVAKQIKPLRKKPRAAQAQLVSPFKRQSSKGFHLSQKG